MLESATLSSALVQFSLGVISILQYAIKNLKYDRPNISNILDKL